MYDRLGEVVLLTSGQSLVNNAGLSVESRREPQKLHETSEQDFDVTMAVNLRSIFLCSKYVLQQMVKQGADEFEERGSIINLSSIYGLVGGYNNGEHN